MRSLRKSKRGVFFFVIDVIIGIMIFFVTIVIITSFHTSKPSLDASENTIKRVSETLFEIRISQFENNDKIIELREQDKIPDYDMSIEELAAYYWHQNDVNTSKELIGNSTMWMSSQTGFSYIINGTEIYRKEAAITEEQASNVKLSRKKITMVGSEGNESYQPIITEVKVWQ
ncbi:MAG: hypothetical protein ACQESE_02915 [Nanobdellota archaeon]